MREAPTTHEGYNQPSAITAKTSSGVQDMRRTLRDMGGLRSLWRHAKHADRTPRRGCLRSLRPLAVHACGTLEICGSQ
ncbi:hypothetical protein GCM10009862_18220 [Microbacterium binotii]|uniref:Uncharacterized protein n=1 Tax=Microbacterium binotii TaxID=462710 RepID=A0ABN3PHH7_9MICO